ncbi:MAG TPA: glycosyltransferase family 2 protein [Terriglobales bacterium]|nr:glycosyltransferase family 2 protein [Terriglobales bacterium]
MATVSIVVPCYNEQETISKLLFAIYAQTFQRAELEVIIADGLSADQTRKRITEFQRAHQDLLIRVIENPSRKIPVGLNLAIGTSQSEFILRLDAHCVPRPDYVTRSIEDLKAGKGWNVGGVWDIQPGSSSWIAKSIAVAAAHPLGVGDALYRYTDHASEVDTVPFGAFRRSLIEQIGGFDETLETNEDYEFNARIRRAGGHIWLDPAIRSIYYARPTLGALALQYARYGYWKVRMLRKYPQTIRLRQAIPPLFVLSLVFLALLSLWMPAQILLKIQVVSYAALLIFAAVLKAFQQRQASLVIGIPLAMIIMHISWGAAFLGSLLTIGADRQKTQTNG